MTEVDRRRLFRAAAVEAHATGRSDGRPLDIGAHVTARAYAALLAVVLAALVAGSVITAEDAVTGAATIGARGTVVVALPISVAGDVKPGIRLDLSPRGGRSVHTHISAVEGPVPEASAATKVSAADLPPGPAAVIVDATIPQNSGAPRPGPARARLILDRRPVIVLLVPALRQILG